MNIFEDDQNYESIANVHTIEDECFDQIPTQVDLGAVRDRTLWNGLEAQENLPISEMLTWVLPVVNVEHAAATAAQPHIASVANVDSSMLLLRNLIKSSGVYALSAIAAPLVSLVIAPFLTHSLSPTDYGILTILNTAISLGAGITQLGLASAFFRAYNYDYTSPSDRRCVLTTATLLLCIFSILVVIAAAIEAPFLADFLFGRSSLGNLIDIAAAVILLQNLAVPGFAWMRAESRALFYSLLSIGNLIVTLMANIAFVGWLHWGIAGSLVATGSGYASVIICTLPVLLSRASISARVDIARSMLAFGAPFVLNVISYWALQVLDRFLLSRFGSLAQAAIYAVVYSLGSALSVVVIAPFTLAWPTAMFAIAKREDAPQVFRVLFRWLCMLLLFAAFGLSVVGKVLLYWLFPSSYHSDAIIIPVVATSIAFYGIYFVFMIGTNIKRKTWMAGVFVTIAAIVNVALNLVLIPHYGAMGAAISTLLAYAVLTVIAYIVNQRIYPIPFEINIFLIALLIGVVLYLGSDFLARQFQETYITRGISALALVLYGGCLVLLGKIPIQRTIMEKLVKRQRIR